MLSAGIERVVSDLAKKFMPFTLIKIDRKNAFVMLVAFAEVAVEVCHIQVENCQSQIGRVKSKLIELRATQVTDKSRSKL